MERDAKRISIWFTIDIITIWIFYLDFVILLLFVKYTGNVVVVSVINIEQLNLLLCSLHLSIVLCTSRYSAELILLEKHLTHCFFVVFQYDFSSSF